MSTYIDFEVENNGNNPKLKDCVIISKYKTIFAKSYTPGGVFVIRKVKSTVPWTYTTEVPHGEEVVIEMFYEK